MGYQRRVHGDSSIGSKRRTMIKIAILVCLAALAAAEADADAYYGPYGYSQYSQGYNWPMNYGSNWPMYSGNMWSMHHGYNYGKRSAEAEPTADADAYYGPYSGYNWNMNNNWNMNRNWNMNNMNYMNNRNMYSGNMWNRYGMQQRYNSYNYGKRSADAEPKAEPKAEAEAEPEAEPEAEAYNWPMMNMMNSGYNWPMNSGYMWHRPGMQGYSYHSYNYGKRSAEADAWYGPYGYPRYMSYMNRPYHYYGYRYHF